MAKYNVIALIVFLIFISCEKSTVSNLHKSPIYLNHIYLNADDTTYLAINNSGFLKDKFASINLKTIKAGNNESWTGTYITGQNTYIELFNSGNEKNQGFSGVGFGIEIVGGVDSLSRFISESDSNNFVKGVMTIKTEAGQIPWFYYLNSTMEDSSSLLSTWVMEYDFEYMKYKFSDIYPEEINITRKFYNIKSFREDLLLKDIMELELALNEFDTNKLIKELEIYGYQIKHKGKLTIGNGPDIKIIIRAKTELKSGICRIKLSLTDKQYEPQTIIFGHKSKLILNRDRTAEWHFDI